MHDHAWYVPARPPFALLFVTPIMADLNRPTQAVDARKHVPDQYMPSDN